MTDLYSVADLTYGIREAILDNINFDGFHVEVSEWLNNDADIARIGWIGIYRQNVDYSPRTLGLGTKSWQANINIRIIVQACDYTSGRNCEVLLETRVKNLLKVLFDGDFIRSYIQMVNAVDVNYGFLETDESSNAYFQEATLTLAVQASINVT